jgi:uncharacterized membrane protein
MEELLVTAVGYLKLAVEAVGAAVVGFGALSTAAIYVLSLLGIRKRSNVESRLFLGRYLALGLEFQIGADILGTAVAPTFAEVQILAAIVVIRTVLNYFFSKEIERERQEVESTKGWSPPRVGRQKWSPTTAPSRDKGPDQRAPMSCYHAVVDGLRVFSLVAGSIVICVGIGAASLEARGAGGRGRVARRMGEHVALGLEFFIGATILNLILNPTWGAVATTTLTIVVRKLVTLSLGLSAEEGRSVARSRQGGIVR